MKPTLREAILLVSVLGASALAAYFSSMGLTGSDAFCTVLSLLSIGFGVFGLALLFARTSLARRERLANDDHHETYGWGRDD